MKGKNFISKHLMYIIRSLYILLSNNIALEFQVLPDLRFFMLNI